MSQSLFEIRTAEAMDASSIARVHVDSWRTTYKGILPDHLLASLSYENRTQSALNRIQDPLKDNYVAYEKKSGLIVGFADIGPSREKNLKVEGEIQTIYLFKDYQGKGIGRLLFMACVEQFKKRQFKDFFVSVFSENKSSALFYQKMGGELIGHDHVDIENVRHKTDTYFWKL